VLVDSSSATGLLTSGSATLTAGSIGVVGGYTGTGYTPTPKTGVIAASDPLAYLQAPAVQPCNFTSLSLSNAGTSGSYYQLYPGTYCAGIKISNGFTHFNPGTYVLAGGGLTSSGGALMNGTGITFYNTSGTAAYKGISLNGSSFSNFSAPTSGAYTGILFFQDRAIPLGAAGSTISGGAGTTYDGALYFPTTTLTYSGNSSLSGYSIVVGYKITISGSSTLGTNYSSLTGGSPIKGSVLVE